MLGQIGREDVWTKHVGPQIKPKLLPEVYAGIDATFDKVFHTSSYGLIAFAALLTVWEISGAARGCMGALSRIYDTDDTRPWWIRFPISIGIAPAMTAAGSLLGVYFLTTYLYVGAIVLLVGIQLDELLLRDVQGNEDRGILDLVRGVL